MRSMRGKMASVAAAAAMVAMIGAPASAGSVTITDPDGTDYDPACLVHDPYLAIAGCPVSISDGSAESVDLRSVTLSSSAVTHGASNTQLRVTWTVDGPIPPAGSTCIPALGGSGCPDTPGQLWSGFGYRLLFQNRARQNNLPTNPVGGGCPRIVTGTVFDQHGHWLDGYHHFIGFDVAWDGTRWVHGASVGEYDPSPDGAFTFTELGVNNGSGWENADPNATFGTHWNASVSGSTATVSVDGVLASANVLCTNSVYNTVYAKAGDAIVNVKAVTTADHTLMLPVTVPTSLVPGQNDITAVGGFAYFADLTAGNSGNFGLVGTALRRNRTGTSYTPGTGGVSDTWGESAACPTPTYGGNLPQNPNFNPNIGCHYDDDNIPHQNPSNPAGPWTATDPGLRGTFNPEWWDTAYGFTA